MRTLLGLCLFSSLALADVPGPKRICIVPDGCVSCGLNDHACIDPAVDAGLVVSDCVSSHGSPQTYVCPPGHPAVAGCGCSSVEALGLIGVGALLSLVRRRRSRPHAG